MVAAALPILLAALAPGDWLAADSPALRVAAETTAGLGVLFVWWVVQLRAGRTGLRADLLLAGAVGILALSSMFVALLILVIDVHPDAYVTWIPVPGRLAAGALLIAAGSLDPARVANPSRRWVQMTGTAMLAVCLAGAGAGLGALMAGGVPASLQLLAAALFLAAALTLSGRARRGRDPALAWFAAAATVLAAARISCLLVEAPADSWVSLADLVRLEAVALLVVGSLAELRAGRRRTVEDALDLERRRLAREIHDGLAQELAFIVSQSRRLARRGRNEGALELLARAGETALMDSRRMIFALRSPVPTSLSTAVAERAYLIAERTGIAIEVEVLDQVSVSPDVEHSILRIIDEAVSNATRHAEATSVTIRISSDQGRVVIRISDDGRGFDDRENGRRRGFGLVGMAERAESLGGSLRLESELGEGTVIEVAF